MENGKRQRILSDGAGLYLRISQPPSERAGDVTRYWIAKVPYNGVRRDVGLGNWPEMSIAEAREANEAKRVLARQGTDPVRRKDVTGIGTPTFAEAVDAYLVHKLSEFRNPKHRQQWQNTLRDYACFPDRTRGLGDMKVDKIEPSDVARVLKRIWTDKTETASRVRGRIENVLDYAKAVGKREGDNPARWRGNLEFLLASPEKIKKVKGHAMMPYRQVPAFWTKLAGTESVAAEALRLLILTGMRQDAVTGARWNEFDGNLWTVPADRMKSYGEEFRIPLCSSALEVAHRVRGLNDTYLFPGLKGDRPITDAATTKCLKVTPGGEYYTVHGFRKSLRTWLQDKTDCPFEIGEAILAHKVGNAVTRAYATSDVVAKRRHYLNMWGAFVIGTS